MHQKTPDLPQSRRGRKGSQRRSSMSARDDHGFFPDDIAVLFRHF
jgi:hypothetical protein